ncbi:MAG: hypothetical protein RL754_1110 [Bacteroidota bacterium]|jgi:3-methyladenine DNA glycosylase AlkD
MPEDHPIYRALKPLAEPDRIADFSRYFKNYEGGYGEGDRFMGVMVPNRRAVAKESLALWSEDDLRTGLIHPVHDVRHTALFAVVRLYESQKKNRAHWHDFLKVNYSGMDNWDLVDSCAHKVFGRQAVETGREDTLLEFLSSSNTWHQRTALVATLWHQKVGDIQTTLSYCPQVALGAPDILQKGIGWVLKTAWQQRPEEVVEHLDIHYRSGLYTRLIVRITLEKASPTFRKEFLG